MTLRILFPLALLLGGFAPAASAQVLEGRAVDRESLEPVLSPRRSVRWRGCTPAPMRRGCNGRRIRRMDGAVADAGGFPLVPRRTT
ncbi:MAG TPA: hypothetical protein VLK84_03720 [Longimicrobium sp.]|nr:hypothetical protein [Longimicrobium sp.]